MYNWHNYMYRLSLKHSLSLHARILRKRERKRECVCRAKFSVSCKPYMFTLFQPACDTRQMSLFVGDLTTQSYLWCHVIQLGWHLTIRLPLAAILYRKVGTIRMSHATEPQVRSLPIFSFQLMALMTSKMQQVSIFHYHFRVSALWSIENFERLKTTKLWK